MIRIIEYVRLFVDLVIEFIFSLFGPAKETIPPPKNPLLLLGATEIAEGIRTKRFTCTTVVTAYIDRIYEVNDIINAMVDFRFEDALEEAGEIDKNIHHYSDADFAAKPLLGVPFTTKESTQCKGMSVTFGLKARKCMRAKSDAAVIKNMRHAGAILLGVTNIPQLNMWTETHNPLFGITRNPYDTTRQVGGSSGGEAALIASCGSPFGVGTDIGGSIRIPAYMCGIFGHKCSNGLTDTTGLTYRDGSANEKTMVSAGPMVRKAADLTVGVKVILGQKSGYLNLDAPVNTKNLKFYYIEKSGDMRVSPVHGDVKYALKMVVDHFKTDRSVEKLDIPMLKHTTALYRFWLTEEQEDFALGLTNKQYTPGAIKELLKYLLRFSDFSFSAIMVLINGQLFPKVERDWAIEITNEIYQYLMLKLGNDGVLIYPTWPQVATQHHVGYFRPYNFGYTSIFNVLKLPVTQVPLGLNQNGLPLGVQIVAAPYQDRLCIAVAKELEKVFGGYTLPSSVQMNVSKS